MKADVLTAAMDKLSPEGDLNQQGEQEPLISAEIRTGQVHLSMRANTDADCTVRPESCIVCSKRH